VAGPRRDHVRVEIRDDRRATDLIAEPVAEGPIDRPVLLAGRRRRGPRSERLSDRVEIALVAAARRRDGMGERGDLALREHLLMQHRAIVDRELQLRAGPDQGRISETRHLG
jgi:hypothetical protein